MDAIIRGTTPTIVYNMPEEFDPTILELTWLTFTQEGREVFTIENPTREGNKFVVKLTQEQTLGLNSKYKAQHQLRMLAEDGTCMATKEREVRVLGILKGGVMNG